MPIWIDNPQGSGTRTDPFRAPEGHVGSIFDLRSLAGQSIAAGFIVYDADSKLTATARPLGNADAVVSEKEKRVVESALGIKSTLQANHVGKLLWEIATTQADPTGDERMKPMRGSIGRRMDLRIGRQRMHATRLTRKSPELANMLSQLRSEFKAARDSRGAAPDLMKFGGAMALKFAAPPEELFPAYKADQFLWPKTVYTDDFNRADNSTLGASWTEPGFTGDSTALAILSNQLDFDPPNTNTSSARWTDALSSDDMRTQIEIISVTRVTGNTILIITCRQPNTGALTCYYVTARHDGTPGIALSKLVTGSFTSLVADTNATLSGVMYVQAIDSLVGANVSSTTLGAVDTAITGNLYSGIAASVDATTGEWTADNWQVADILIDSGGGGGGTARRPRIQLVM